MAFGGGGDKTKLESFVESNETPSLLGQFGKEGMKGNTVTQKANQVSGIRLNPASALENLATGDISSQYNMLRDFLGRGPGAESIDLANRDQQSFVDMMRQINASGGMPTDEDRRQANIFADDLFKPQMEALNQAFTQQNEGAARLAAQLNRPINDPIIQSKLRQEQMRQSAMLGADRAAFTAQESRNSPFRRLELQGQLADAQGALASQAMANRMQLLNLGNALQSQERNWRLQTSERYASGTQTQHSGGGLMGGLGAMTGAFGSVMGAIGSGMSLGAVGGQQTGNASTAQQQKGAMTPMAAYTPGGNGDYSTFQGARDPFPMTSAYAPSSARQSRITQQPRNPNMIRADIIGLGNRGATGVW